MHETCLLKGSTTGGAAGEVNCRSIASRSGVTIILTFSACIGLRPRSAECRHQRVAQP
jgi:hypothetical protein